MSPSKVSLAADFPHCEGEGAVRGPSDLEQDVEDRQEDLAVARS